MTAPDIREEFERKTNLVEEKTEMISKQMEDQCIDIKMGILEIAEDILKKDNSFRRKPWINQKVVEIIS